MTNAPFACIDVGYKKFYYPHLADALDASEKMSEGGQPHRVLCRADSGQYVDCTVQWIPDCSDPVDDSFGGVLPFSNQWNGGA